MEARRYRLSTLLRWGWWVPACSRGTLNKSSTRPVRAITSPAWTALSTRLSMVPTVWAARACSERMVSSMTMPYMRA